MIPPVSKCSWVICIMWSMPTVGWSWWVDCRTVTLNLPSGHMLSHEGIACLAWYSTQTLRHLKISSNKIPNLKFFFSCFIPCVIDWALTFLVMGFSLPSRDCCLRMYERRTQYKRSGQKASIDGKMPCWDREGVHRCHWSVVRVSSHHGFRPPRDQFVRTTLLPQRQTPNSPSTLSRTVNYNTMLC